MGNTVSNRFFATVRASAWWQGTASVQTCKGEHIDKPYQLAQATCITVGEGMQKPEKWGLPGS